MNIGGRNMSTMSESRTRIRWMLGFWVVTVLLIMGVARTVSAGGETESSTPTLTITEDWAVTLSLVDGPDNWWFRINYTGTCTAASGDTVTNIRGYQAGDHVVWVYADSGCSQPLASTGFTLSVVTLSAVTVGLEGRVDLVLAGGPDSWWFTVTGADTCAEARGSNVTVVGFDPGDYVIQAYPDDGCKYAMASAVVTVT